MEHTVIHDGNNGNTPRSFKTSLKNVSKICVNRYVLYIKQNKYSSRKTRTQYCLISFSSKDLPAL